jgi:hypothetical protein
MVNYKINGSIGASDGVTGTIQNIKADLGEISSPIDTEVSSIAIPSVLVGINSDNKTNLLQAVSVRDDTVSKNIGLGTFPISVNNFIGGYFQNATGAKSIFTPSLTDRTFITGLHATATANVTCDSILYSLGFGTLINGVNQNNTIHLFNKETLTAWSDVCDIQFASPIELTKGTAVTLSVTFGAGATVVYADLFGYTIKS